MLLEPLVYTPECNNPPASAYATLDERNGHPVLDFDGATDEEAIVRIFLPSTYGGGSLQVTTVWSFTSATSGSLRVQTAFERINTSGLDTDSDSFASFNSSGGTAPGTSGQVIEVQTTHTSSEIDGLLAGEMGRLKVRRDADGTSGTDDIATDSELWLIRIEEV